MAGHIAIISLYKLDINYFLMPSTFGTIIPAE